LRVNIIGAGHWGPNLIRAFSSIPDVTVGMVAELDPQRLALVKKNSPWVETTSDANQAILDPAADAIVIVTPVSTHFALAKQALAAGKHVFVEKPLCKSSAEARELIALAAAQKKTLMVGHIFLFNPGILKVKEIIESGALGRIIYIDAVRTNLGPIRNDINALWDLASHDFAIFDFWLGRPSSSISATGNRVSENRHEDVVFATVRYEGGVMAHVHASWLNPRKVRQITVVGEHKMVVWDDINLSQAVQIYSHGVVVDKNDYLDSFGSHRLKYHQGDLLVPRIPGGEPLFSECSHFVECIRTGNPPRTGGDSGKRVVDILAAADRSLAAHGVYVEITP
jgi:predicted dehydrogenase